DIDGDALDLRNDHLVREAQVHDQVLTLLGHTVADAVNLQLLLVAVGHTDDHVMEQSAGQAVEAAVQLVVGRTLHGDRAAFLFKNHLRAQSLRQLALGSLNGHHITLGDIDGDAGGNGNGHSANSRHGPIPSLPNECQDLAADMELAGLLVGHDALGRRDDSDAQAAEHAGQLVGAHIDAQAGLGDAAQAGD
ncbi:Putative manganese efflux pump MntP, partial [Dysosmobacter welbionis]